MSEPAGEPNPSKPTPAAAEPTPSKPAAAALPASDPEQRELLLGDLECVELLLQPRPAVKPGDVFILKLFEWCYFNTSLLVSY